MSSLAASLGLTLSVALAGQTGPEAEADSPLRVAVVPVFGDWTEDLPPAEATAILVETLREMEGLTVVDLRGLAQTLGTDALRRLLACRDDGCRQEAAAQLPWDRLVVAERARDTLRIRLLRREPGATPDVRVSLQIDAEPRAALRAAVFELFPGRAAQLGSDVVISNLPPGGAVRIDGGEVHVADSSGQVKLRLPPGAYALEARAPGHAPWTTTLETPPGEAIELSARLSKRRSQGPLWLAIGGGAALLAGGAFLVAGDIRVSDWDDACASGTCAEGFTRERFQGDADALNREQWAGGALLVAGGLAVAGAAIWFLLDPGKAEEGDLFTDGAALGVRF